MKTVKIRFVDEALIIGNLGREHLHLMREELVRAFKRAHPDLAIRRVDKTRLEIEKAVGVVHPVFLIAESMEAAPGIPADVCFDYRGIDGEVIYG